MKKLIALLLVAFMMFAFCSCGGKDKDAVLSSSTESVSSKVASSADETETSSEEPEKNAKTVTRYFLYGPGKSLKTTYDVDYSEDGKITVNLFDRNNYKTGSHVYEYDENGLVMFFGVYDKDGNEKGYTTYEYSNNMKISAEYYYEEDALRSTTEYQYNENGVIVSKTVEKVGEAEVYKWDYANNGDKPYAVYISTPSRPNFEGYNFADNANGKLYQKVHIVNGISNDYWSYDYDADGDCIYRGYYNVQHSLVEYYEFKYGEASELAAKAFKGTGILD